MTKAISLTSVNSHIPPVRAGGELLLSKRAKLSCLPAPYSLRETSPDGRDAPQISSNRWGSRAKKRSESQNRLPVKAPYIDRSETYIRKYR